MNGEIYFRKVQIFLSLNIFIQISFLSSDKSDIKLGKAEEKHVSFHKFNFCRLIELNFKLLQQLHHGHLHLCHGKTAADAHSLAGWKNQIFYVY